MENVKFYESPELHHLDAESEGVLCQSSNKGSFNPYDEIAW